MLLRTDSGAAQNCGQPQARPSGLGLASFPPPQTIPPARGGARTVKWGADSEAATRTGPPAWTRGGARAGEAGPGRGGGAGARRRGRGAEAGPGRGGGAGARRRGAEAGLRVVVSTRGVAEVPWGAEPGRGGGLQWEGGLFGSSALGARQSVLATLARRFVSNLGPKVMFFQVSTTFRDASSSSCSVLDLQNFALGHNPATMLTLSYIRLWHQCVWELRF